jgi:hypothetical protein
MNDFLVGLLMPIIINSANGVFTDAMAKDAGFKIGAAITAAGRKALPDKPYEQVETLVQKKLELFVTGIQAGLDSDDAVV